MERLRILSRAGTLILGTMAALSVGVARSAPITIVDNGPWSNRVDIVFMGDGYTQADHNAGIYNAHILSYLDEMFTPGDYTADPFPRYHNFFNVHKIPVVSVESGADIPSQGVFRNTALDATYDTAGIDRFLTISTLKAITTRDLHLAGTGLYPEMQFVTVNHDKYGGSGGSFGVFAGANESAREIALHELGHAFSYLEDEYVSSSGPYPYGEPLARNVTKNSSGQKWSQWLGFEDPRDATLDIGVFEGAATYASGIYRPSSNSKMRTLGRAFDAVSREAIILDIYNYVDPLDDWLDNSLTVNNTPLWVDVVDPDVIRLQWFVNGALVPGATGSFFSPSAFGYGPGIYNVRARAYDEILDYAFTGGEMDLVRSNYEALEQTVTWTFTLGQLLPGDYDGNSVVDWRDFIVWNQSFGSGGGMPADGNGDGSVDAADYVIWRRHLSEIGQSALGTTPEPAAGGLAVAALLLGIAFRRQRNSL